MTGDVIVLDENNDAVKLLCRRDKRLAKVVAMVGTITYKPHDDSYSFLVSQIIGQMLSNKAAWKIYSRLENLCDGKVCVETINNLTDEQIKNIGTSKPKVKYIRALTDAVSEGRVDFSEIRTMSDDAVITTLASVSGIGMWSAKMYLIFVLNRQDILPYEDVAFLQGYKWVYKTDDVSPEAIKKRCKKWKPYSSIAARYMYRALDMGLTKSEFHLFK